MLVHNSEKTKTKQKKNKYFNTVSKQNLGHTSCELVEKHSSDEAIKAESSQQAGPASPGLAGRSPSVLRAAFLKLFAVPSCEIVVF